MFKHLPIIWASVQSGVYSTSQVACARAGRDAVSAMHWVGDETDDKAAGLPRLFNQFQSIVKLEMPLPPLPMLRCCILDTKNHYITHSSQNKQMVASILV